MKNKKMILIVILAISLLALSGCGGSSSDSTTTQTYSLDVEQSDNGNVNVDPDKDLYNKNEKVSISAETEVKDYEFAYWQGSIDTTKSELDLVINGDMIVKPVFGVLDYEDDFSNKEESILSINTSDQIYTIDIINDKYIMSIDEPGSDKESIFSYFSNSKRDEKYLVKYQAKFALANGNHGYIFNFIDWDNYYVFKISDGGSYTIGKETNGSYEDIVDWTGNDNINPDNQVNQVAVKKIEDKYTFYVNNKKIDSVSIDFNANEFKDGFSIQTFDYEKNEVEFDNLKFLAITN
jgi:predicted component of type VI protein secretion system